MTTSTVVLRDGLGQETEVEVPHSPLASTDSIIELARVQAGVPAEQMRKGEIVQ